MTLLPHSILFFLTSVISAGIALFGLSRRKKSGGWAFVGLMTAIAIWVGAAAVESAVLGTDKKIFWSQVEYIGYVFIGVLLLFFTLHYTRQQTMITTFGRLILWLLPILSLLFVWTNPWHHAVWTGFTPGSQSANILIYHRGPLFWFIIGYTYVFALISCFVFYRARRTPDAAVRHQIDTMLVGTLFPLVSGAFYMFGQDLVHGMDVAPFGFSAAGLIIAWNFFHLRLLDIVPVGRTVLVEKMPDGMVVFDDKGRLVDCNPAAKHMLHIHGESAFRIDTLLKKHPILRTLIQSHNEWETGLTLANSKRELHVRAVPLYDQKERFQGRLLILQDITTRMMAERERDNLIAKLRSALKQIKTLNGLVPICSCCKKIRDDSGYWQQIEAYIRDHSDVEFSHGLCPECSDKLYPELVAPPPASLEKSHGGELIL